MASEISQGNYDASLGTPDDQPDDGNHPADSLGGPPLVADDFEWDEQHVPAGEASEFGAASFTSNASETSPTDSAVTDGMASLTLNKTEGGYLGIASGAALLRLIDPSASESTSRLGLERPPSNGSIRPLHICEQPNPNRQILDSMIDSYFGTYHLSYPIIHEPTFRAQYSEIIDRPNGHCWLVLAYIIAAIGVFNSPATTVPPTDLALFAQAKYLLSINYWKVEI